jgi:transcriptional regulator with XRE-family HTH domain
MAKHILAEVLKKKKLSKRQFAKLIGLRYEHVFRYFRAGYDPKLSVLTLWATALKMTVKSLIVEEPKQKNSE